MAGKAEDGDVGGAGELEAAARAAMAALEKALPLLGPQAAEGLAAIGRLAERAHAAGMAAADLASGAHARRSEPMMEAMAKAMREGSAPAWLSAMQELAQASLAEPRPAWHAAAALAALGIDPSAVGAEAARALALPIEQERALGGGGALWDWPSWARPVQREAWDALLAAAGLPAWAASPGSQGQEPPAWAQGGSRRP